MGVVTGTLLIHWGNLLVSSALGMIVTVQCSGSGMFIPDRTFSNPDPGASKKEESLFTVQYSNVLRSAGVLDCTYCSCRQCCGSGMFIPDPIFSSRIQDFGSRIRTKEFKYF
jgi:hypothetical protein